MRDLSKAVKQICKDEGFRSKVYKCSNGIDTFGHGLTWITEEESLHIVTTGRAPRFERELLATFSWYVEMPDEVKDVMLNMAFQMGVNGMTKFRKAMAHLSERNWVEASEEMLDSKWARSDSPSRAQRNAKIVRECNG